MSTPNPVTFTPFATAIDWKDATTDDQGNPLPAGEALVTTGVGVRADGDAAHSLGNYEWEIDVPSPASRLTRADFDAAMVAKYGKALAPGNYWLNGDQTDALNGQSATSKWGATEVPFSIPQPVVQPGSPRPFVVS